MGVRVRDWTHWAVGYLPPRASFKLLARRGDPLAQLLSIDTYAVDDIYPLIEQVRQRGRISPIPGLGWVTADAQIVREVLRDGRFRTLKPQDRSPFRAVRWILAKTDPDVANPIEPPSLLVSDPPEHTRLRRPVSRAFTPRADGLRARIHEIADDLLHGFEGRTECDLVADYTSQIPIAIITEMIGMPPDEAPYLQEVAGTITRLIGTTAASWRDFRSATVVLREFDRYLAKHIERLRKDHTGHSILSDVVRSGDLTEIELRMLAGLLLGAGFVTTSHVMSKAVVALIRHPDQVAALSANPHGWPARSKRFCVTTRRVKWYPVSPPKTLTCRDIRSVQAKPCFCWRAGPTAIRQSSRTPVPSTPPVPTPENTSVSVRAFTSVWVRHWLGWNYTSVCSRCSSVSPS